MSWFCPGCRSRNASTNRFCDECGTPRGGNAPGKPGIAGPGKPDVGSRARADEALTIGRGEACDVRVDAQGGQVSRVHARAYALGDGHYRVVDAGSANGLFVQGRRVAEAIVGPGERVGLGSYPFPVSELTKARGRGSAIIQAPRAAPANRAANGIRYGAEYYPQEGAGHSPSPVPSRASGGSGAWIVVSIVLVIASAVGGAFLVQHLNGKSKRSNGFSSGTIEPMAIPLDKPHVRAPMRATPIYSSPGRSTPAARISAPTRSSGDRGSASGNGSARPSFGSSSSGHTSPSRGLAGDTADFAKDSFNAVRIGNQLVTDPTLILDAQKRQEAAHAGARLLDSSARMKPHVERGARGLGRTARSVEERYQVREKATRAVERLQGGVNRLFGR